MKVYFVTCNKNKVREVQEIFGDKHKVEQLPIDYPELRSDYAEEIAKMAAKQLADKLKKPLFVEDSGLFIKALDGLPGTSSAYIHKRIGLKGILKLMKGVKDRECAYVSAVAYCEPGKKPVSFVGSEKGRISDKIKGKNGFGHDPIFIPEKSKKTYGEIDNVEKEKKFRRLAVVKLLRYLERKA
ncbi:MAG: RdgB/HAM1 family non-canonical purine NTP pyrophosphatase [Nanoarchaeota archaeon]|nr:RdgB/HAM1 family non-canonical purine NTP pyrophosphatase [Nanoarchaeota archaeon]